MRRILTIILAIGTLSSFAQFWKPLNYGLDGQPSAIYSQDHRLITATRVDASTGSAYAIKVWNGLFWHELPRFRTDENAVINQILMYKGHIYFSGTFKGVNAENQTFYIIRFNGKKYETLPDFNNKLESLKSVKGMAIYDGNLAVVGDFKIADNPLNKYIVLYNGFKIVNKTALFNSFNGSFNSIASGNDLLAVGGTFTQFGVNKESRYIALFRNNQWVQVEKNEAKPEKMVVYKDSVYFFSNTATGFYRVSPEGEVRKTEQGIRDIMEISDLVSTDSGLIACGEFKMEGELITQTIIEFRNGKWKSIRNGSLSGVGLLAQSGNKLFVSGTFTRFSDVKLNHVAEYISDVGAVQGQVFLDKNGDCEMNNRDEPIDEFTIRVTPGNFFIKPKEDGTFVQLLKEGEYVFEILYRKYWNIAGCSKKVVPVKIKAGELTEQVDFALKQQIGVNDLTLHLTSGSGFTINNNKVVTYNLRYVNTGSVDYENSTVTLKYDSRLSGLKAIPAPVKVLKDSAVWNLSDLEAGEVGNIRVRFNFNSNVLDDVKLVGQIITPQQDAYSEDNQSQIAQTIDYNDDPFKKQSQSSVMSQDTAYLSLTDSAVRYIVSFENYTYDTVRTVHIVDTIRINHSMSRIQDIGSSHDCYSRIIPGLPGEDIGVLIYTCPDVNLVPNPERLTDVYEDQGHVAFEIGLTNQIQEGMMMKNRASVVFDDDPYPTNWAYAMVNSSMVHVEQLSFETIQANVFPNPAASTIAVKQLLDQPQTLGEIYGLNGQLIKQVEIQQGQFNIDELPAGFYVLKIHNNNQIWQAKFMVNR
jgi:hypothetical protein